MRRRLIHLSVYGLPLAAVLCFTSIAGSERSAISDQPSVEGRRPTAGNPSPRRLDTLKRMVRHFDFEEAEEMPLTMPHRFYRYGASEDHAAEGFPPFGRMRLTNEVAYSGNWSFEFELDGGSMAARIPTGVIPVMPQADYLVTMRVRTKGLQHARSRLTAWLHDGAGEIITESRAASEPIATDGEWVILAVEVPGRWDDVSDLVFELQLAQPRQFRSAAAGAGAEEALLEDVAGRAWFDDVTVWHLSRIELSTDEPGNVVVGPDRPRVRVLIRDHAQDDLRARLRVFDLDGKTIVDERVPSHRLQREFRVALPLEQYGWYRAVLDVGDRERVSARQWLDLAYVPQPHRSHARWQNPLAVALPEAWIVQADRLPDLVARSGVGTVIMPVWTRRQTMDASDLEHETLRETIEALRTERTDLILSFEGVPDELSRQFDTDSDDVLRVLNQLDGQWQRWINELLVSFGVEVSRWQIGGTGSDSVLFDHDAARQIERATRRIAEFAPSPDVLVSMMSEQATDATRDLPGRSIWVPHHLQPDAVGEAVAAWTDADHPLVVTLDVLPDEIFSPRQRTLDLIFRVLAAWRADAGTIALRPTWRVEDVQSSAIRSQQRRPAAISPDVLLPVVRALASQLSGRRFVRELTLQQGIHCWVLAGSGSDDGALIVWRDSDHLQETATTSLQLADGPVTMTDPFGNVREIVPRDGLHTIRVREMPMFIEGISLELVLFRGSFALEPSFIPAERRLHGHELILHNPWGMPISGTLRLRESEDWRISPRVHDFSIRPGGQVRLPVEIILERNMLTGVRRLEADVTLSAETTYQIEVDSEIEIGLEHLDLHATWRVARNVRTGEDDLIITQYIANTGDDPVSLDAYILGPNIRQQRRVVGGLEPGEMAIRTFRVPNGASLLSGQSIRVGIAERGGIARLNKVLEVSDLAAYQVTADK